MRRAKSSEPGESIITAPNVRLHWFVISLLTLAYVASYAFVAAIPDTNRDMLIAQQIASGSRFPLEGPILGGAIHLGPVWYYLLAFPMSLTSSWLATCLFVGVLASCKFPLAYVCGRRLVDANAGLMWAAMLALPGWNAYERLTVFNPNVAAAAALALIWLAIHGKSTRAPGLAALVVGVAVGLAIHVHPTVAIVGLLPVATLLANPGRLHRLTRIMLIAIGALLPLTPYLIGQFFSGAPDAVAAQNYVRESAAFANLAQLPVLFWSYFVVGPRIAIEHLADISGVGLVSTGVLVAAVHLIAATGIARAALADWNSRRFTVALLAGLLFACGWVVALRPNTPVYFTYVLSPLFAGALAYGVSRLPSRALPVAVIFLTVISVGFSMRIAFSIATTMKSGVGALPGAYEVKRTGIGENYVDVWFPAYAHADFGKFLCALPQGASLHGPLAYLADWNLNTDALLACGRLTAASLGGVGSARVAMGMPLKFWQQLDFAPQCTLGSLGITMAAKPLASSAASIATGDRYLPRDFLKGDLRPQTYSFRLAAGDALLVTNFLFPYHPIKFERVKLNGIEVQAIMTTEMSRLYKTTLGAFADGDWQIDMSAISAMGLDIVSIPAANHARFDNGANTPACIRVNNIGALGNAVAPASGAR